MTSEITLPTGIELVYTDLFGPLMPYCTDLTREKIVFRLPKQLLSGPGNKKAYDALFNRIDVENEINDALGSQYSSGYVERTVGNWQTVTLWFKQPLSLP